LKRAFDIIVSLLLLIPGLPLMAIAAIAIYFSDGRPVIFAQTRVGKNQVPFTCLKLRTMRRNTPSRASHEVGVDAIFPAGKIIRKFKLDELPQLFNVIAGTMSLVGPRPCLPNQTELVTLRANAGIFAMTPGVTGLAQVRDIDMSIPARLVACETEYAKTRGFVLDTKLLIATFLGGGLKVDAASKSAAQPENQRNAKMHSQPHKNAASDLIIGASGFVGLALARRLCANGNTTVRLAQRQMPLENTAQHDVRRLPRDYLQMSEEELDALFIGIKNVYFLAAATPQALARMQPDERDQALKGNAEMPTWFARAAHKRAVERFIHVSSCGVHGEYSLAGAFTETSPFVAHDGYVSSKIEAENLLLGSMQDIPALTIVRPPMVYGAGLKGPMRHLLNFVAKGIPLPLGLINRNRRSMIGANNLADFLVHCAMHEAAVGQTYLVADNEPISTAGFLRLAASASGKSSRLIPVPAALLKSPLSILGRGAMFDRVFGDYLVDDSKARRELQWTAPFTASQELKVLYQNSTSKPAA
jgi:O-antigen biosynthesis protein WbqP